MTWEKKLIEKYPELLGNIHYFECLEGWKNLIIELIKEIIPWVSYYSGKYENEDDFEFIRVIQIKEKYGTLRFYINICYKPIDKIIDLYEDKSRFICEECGEKGSLREYNKWYYTRCDKCWRKGNITVITVDQAAQCLIKEIK